MNLELNREITPTSVLKFTLPSIFMMVIMSLYTIVDGIFVSRLVNTDAFSAVNIVYPMFSVVIGLGTMFGAGTTAIVSRKLGENKQLEAKQIVSFIVYFTIGLGILITLISFLFLEDIIWMLGANEDIYDYCYGYAFPLLFFVPFNLLQMQFQSLFVANSKPQLGLIVTIISGVANIILDYLFIAHFNMGVSGAAIATGIGYGIAALFGIYYFAVHKEASLHFVKPKANWRALANAMSNGSSEMVSCLSTSITTFLFNIIMMRLVGPDGVAAVSILLYIDFVLIAINLGYSIGAAPLFSYNYGCNEREKLHRLFRISAGFCAMVGIGMTTGTLLFSSQLAGIFSPKDSQVYLLALSGLVVFAFSYLFKGYNIFISAMFTAFGNGKVSAFLSFMRTLVLIVLTTLLFSSLFGVTGVWYAMPVAEVLSFLLALLCTVKFRRRYHYLS